MRECASAMTPLSITYHAAARFLLTVLTFLFVMANPSRASAIDPGTAKGALRVGDDTIALTHAYAHLHDNAEGALDRPTELRVLITDREVKQETLRGLVFLPITTLAREGKVRGLLVRFDPADPTKVEVTLLLPPVNPMATLVT